MFLFLLGTYLGVELLSYGNSMFNIWGNARLLSTAAAPFYIPPAVYEGSKFSTSLPTHVIVICLLIIAILMEVLSHCGFDLHFPND